MNCEGEPASLLCCRRSQWKFSFFTWGNRVSRYARACLTRRTSPVLKAEALGGSILRCGTINLGHTRWKWWYLVSDWIPTNLRFIQIQLVIRILKLLPTLTQLDKILCVFVRVFDRHPRLLRREWCLRIACQVPVLIKHRKNAIDRFLTWKLILPIWYLSSCAVLHRISL